MATLLTDMEELLARVVAPQSRDYMGEALRCYQAGAFRGCVVLSCIALFHDLRSKLAPVATVNKLAKQLHTEVEKKAQGQEVFEAYLSDQLASCKLIEPLEKTSLDVILTLRNKCAHPSGSHPSAEQARFVFHETIEKFLSRPALQTNFAADATMQALAEGNFFPTNHIDSIAAAVQADLANIHVQARPYLVAKLVEAATNSPPALVYLLGLANFRDASWRQLLSTQLIHAKATSTGYAAIIVGVISMDPVVATGLDDVVRARIIALIKSTIPPQPGTTITAAIHPLQCLVSLVVVNGQAATWKDFQPVVEALFAQYLYEESLMELLTQSGPIQEAYLATFIERAKDSAFDIAKLAANALPAADKALGVSVSEETSFRIVSAVLRAAEYGCWAAQNQRNNKFTTAPTIRAKALSFLTSHPTHADSIRMAYFLSASVSDIQSVLV
jgi:hypothetical protein